VTALYRPTIDFNKDSNVKAKARTTD